jgi:uncharacterized protein
LKSSKSNFDKDLAIYTQKIEFQQIEINDLRGKNKELNDSYQKYLENAHSDSQSIEEMYSRKLSEVAQDHQHTVRSLETEYEQKLRDIRGEHMRVIQDNEQLQA